MGRHRDLLPLKLHVITAVTRPENLPRIAHSLQAWGDVDVIWHLRFDVKRRHVGGQALKNAMLDDIEDGWVCFLDDDTVAHKRFYQKADFYCLDGFHSALVISQRRKDREILHAAAKNVEVGGIDIGQAVIRRDVIGDQRIPEDYAGDGEFLISVLRGREDVVYLDEILSFHNALAKE